MIGKVQKKIETLLEKKPLAVAIWSFLTVGLICALIGVLIIFPNAGSFEEYFNVTKTGPLGDTFNGLLGPFIAFLVAILTFLAFYIQYKANELQNEANALIQFENKFYDLIKLHRDNVSELKYSKIDGTKMTTSEARKVFRVIVDEFIECLHEVKKFVKIYDDLEILTPKYKLKLEKIRKDNKCIVDVNELAMIDIAYCFVFFGLSKDSDQVFLNLFWNRYNKEFAERIRKYLQLKPRAKENDLEKLKAWEEFENLPRKDIKEIFDEIFYYKKNHNASLSEKANKLYLNYNETKYYGGHQHRLGHYFRHLFQSYKFLSSQIKLTPDDKYYYGKTLRAQLSTYEQFLLFVNSLSSLGMKWEYTVELEDLETAKNKDILDFKFITRYNLIKNLPGSQYYDLTYREFYPDVKFEYRDDISYK